MCELLGLSSNHETTINISLGVLAERGENPRLHGDGWGIAFHQGRDVRLIKDAGPAKNSKWVEFIRQREIRAHDIIAHIRRSTVGKASYSNTHPFIRELVGRVHSFAHNGTLTDIHTHDEFRSEFYQPVGETDSEFAFCHLMHRMRELWKKFPGKVPTIESRFEIVTEFANKIRTLGPANFLYSDGDTVFAHGDERHDPITHELVWPGLHYRYIVCERSGAMSGSPDSALTLKAEEDVVTLFASVPLDESEWLPMKKGEVIAATRGKLFSSQRAKAQAPDELEDLEDSTANGSNGHSLL